MKVIKRNGEKVKFDKTKIKKAILKAMVHGSGIVREDVADKISNEIEKIAELLGEIKVKNIEDAVYQNLIKSGQELTAKTYEGYRAVQEFKRKINTTDDSVLTLVMGSNEDVMKENSNKDGRIIPTQRDLVAGEISKDIVRRKLLPAHIVQAHDEGILHFHDMDYFLQPMFNCCLINLKDMLDNGTVINGKMIDSPQSFHVACIIMTQIIAQVSSSQYGGQSINVKHLGKYLKLTEDKYREILSNEKDVQTMVEKELISGVQAIQYQINTLTTLNGQSPFVTLFLEIDEKDEYKQYAARIIDEILKQRLKGVKNEKGVYVTPSFPKLVYVLDEHNSLNGGEFDFVTETAIKCSSKRLYPDYISAKKMRETYEGNVFSPMGCRSFLSPWKDKEGNYKFEGRFNMGVVSLNLPQMGIISSNEEEFWKILDERLKLCFDALMCRYKALKGVRSDVSPIHWQHGVLARLKKGETIDKLLVDGHATISLGYIGLYELTKLITGETHTSKKGSEFAVRVMKKLKETTEQWKEETGLGFGLYGTPAESLCHRFAKIDKKKFGSIEDVTDKDYYTNSYHVDVREEIDAFDKLSFESQFQPISTGGCISYIEIPNMNHNIEAMRELVKFIYDSIQYAEFNTKSDYCHICSFDGEIKINDELQWECPQCGNKDKDKMNVTRRTCGYLGDNFWNDGKTNEIKQRVLHL